MRRLLFGVGLIGALDHAWKRALTMTLMFAMRNARQFIWQNSTMSVCHRILKFDPAKAPHEPSSATSRIPNSLYRRTAPVGLSS